MQMNYEKYGEICNIDSTYRVNLYSVPLVIIGGLNNEGKNVIFGMGLINNEKEDTYIWILKEFKKLFTTMPSFWICDEDKSIIGAIKTIYPGNLILICLWHIIQNIKKHCAYLCIIDGGNEIRNLIYSLPFFKRTIEI